MRTEIWITGQISGNHRLYNRLLAVGSRVESYKEGLFHSKLIVFETKRAAKQALWKAYTSLCAEEPGQRNKTGGINYSAGSSLSYDASQATITNNN
jgi:hypothetical protein